MYLHVMMVLNELHVCSILSVCVLRIVLVGAIKKHKKDIVSLGKIFQTEQILAFLPSSLPLFLPSFFPFFLLFTFPSIAVPSQNFLALILSEILLPLHKISFIMFMN